MHTQKKNLG